MNRVALLAIVLSASIAAPALAEPTATVDVEMLRRKQEHQQRARDLARELVSSILDIQLQQLSENGLEHLPLYRDINEMRTHLDGLVEAEMAEVVNLLLKAQDQLPAEREATFVEARKKTREVVVRLSIERQNLLRRLKTAELAAQVKRLIAMQTIVTNSTQSLPAQPNARQEAALVATIQDERDVQALFVRLLEMLREVRGWGGEVGQGAAEGLAILRTSGVAQQLANAIADLEMAEFGPANDEEASVLKGLRLLLEKIEETQGLVGTDRELALENVRQLIAQQQQLRDDTRAADLDEGTIDKLIERQATLQKEIGRLPEMLGRVPAALPAVEAARRAASDASAKLFDGKRPEAVARQTVVAAQLATVEQQLLAAAQRPDGAQSAAQLKSMTEALAEAEKQIEQAQAETAQAEVAQTEAAQAAKPPSAAGQRQLEHAAQRLAEIKPQVALPEAVKSAIQEAAEETLDAAHAAAQKPAAPAAADTPLQTAKRAQQHAKSEVAAALADARREMLTTKFEELSQAAEALDRAVGTQRDVAQQAAKAAAAEGLKPELAKELAAHETAVGQVAKKVAEAVKQAVPDTDKPLEQAQAAIEAARRELAPDADTKDKPDAHRAGQQAERAVAPLTAAADQLRAAAGQAARELDAESRKQLSAVEPVRDAVAQMSMAVPSADDTSEKLAQAAQKVRAALAQQYRASGKPEAARASELADRLQQAQRQQRAIEHSAADPDSAAEPGAPQPSASQPHASPSAARQQQVAQQVQQAQRAAEEADQATGEPRPQTSPELKTALQRAAEATANAAKAMQAGENAEAHRAREEAQAALAAAQRAAQQEADRAAAQAKGQPSAALQPRVTAAIDEARQLTASKSPQADKLLHEALPASQEAERKLQSGKPQAAQGEQQKVADALRHSAEMLNKAADEQARREAARLAAEADRSAKLAAEVAKLDPAALDALQAAEQTARRQANTPDPEQAPAARQQVNQDLQRAAASLAARGERIRHDQATAGKLLKAAESQGLAAAEIQAGRQALAAAAASGKAAGKPDARQTMAKPAARLEQAMKQYAQAADAGERAAEEANDTGAIADPALLDALAAAAKLRPAPAATPAPSAAAAEPAKGAAAGKPAADAAGKASGDKPSGGIPAGDTAGKPAPAAGSDSKSGPLSAEETAQMLAGSEAVDQLAALRPAAAAQGKPGQAGKNGSPAAKPSTAAQAAADARKSAAAAKSDPSSANSIGEPDAQEPGTHAGDSHPGQRTFREEPWVAKLPPELRQAIRAQSQRRPPRAYEERLRRYFENID